MLLLHNVPSEVSRLHVIIANWSSAAAILLQLCCFWAPPMVTRSMKNRLALSYLFSLWQWQMSSGGWARAELLASVVVAEWFYCPSTRKWNRGMERERECALASSGFVGAIVALKFLRKCFITVNRSNCKGLASIKEPGNIEQLCLCVHVNGPYVTLRSVGVVKE